MKKIHLLLLIVISVFLTSCGHKFGEPHLYQAASNSNEGKEFINQYKVCFVCNKTYRLFWTDFYKSDDGIFVLIQTDNGGKENYFTVKPEFVDKYALEPKFSFWNKYGWIAVSVILILLIILMIKVGAGEFIEDLVTGFN